MWESYLSGVKVYVTLRPYRFLSEPEVTKVYGATVSSISSQCKDALVRVDVGLPDRTVSVVIDDAYRPLDGTYDFFVDTSIYSDSETADTVRYSLISAHNGIQMGLDNRDFIRNDIHKVIGDSGGAQLKFGVTPYVDPYEVIEWYNKVPDIGMALDVAPRPCDNTVEGWKNPIMRACAEVQKQNNRIMEAHKGDRVKLLNVIHGFDYEQQTAWADTVMNDAFDGWAVGAESKNMFSNFLMMANAIRELPGTHYHMFGVASPLRVPVMAWMGKYVPDFTSDSTKYMLGIHGRSFFNMDMYGKLYDVELGNRAKFPRAWGEIPCQCTLCKAVKYWQFYGIDDTIFGHLLSHHNAYAFGKYSRFWSDIAERVSLEEYIAYFRNAMFSGSSVKNKSLAGVELQLRGVDMCIVEGRDEAIRIYGSGNLGYDNRSSKLGLSLFSNKHLTQTSETTAEDVEDETLIDLGASTFSSFFSITLDVLPRFMSEDTLRKDYGIVPQDHIDWDEYNEWIQERIQKNLVPSGNIWRSRFYSNFKQENPEHPIWSKKKRDQKHEVYPMTDKEIKVATKELADGIKNGVIYE